MEGATEFLGEGKTMDLNKLNRTELNVISDALQVFHVLAQGGKLEDALKRANFPEEKTERFKIVGTCEQLLHRIG